MPEVGWNLPTCTDKAEDGQCISWRMGSEPLHSYCQQVLGWGLGVCVTCSQGFLCMWKFWECWAPK